MANPKTGAQAQLINSQYPYTTEVDAIDDELNHRVVIKDGVGVTQATESQRTEEIDPIDQQYVTETLADVTNGADNTYPYFFSMNEFRKAAIQMVLNGGSGTVTVKVYGSVQDDGTAEASLAYEDIGNDVFGAASWTASDVLVDNYEKLAAFAKIKVEVVAATGAADDADWTLFIKRLY